MKKLPPYPLSVSGAPPNPSYVNSWYEILRNLVNNIPENTNHNDLAGLQGGAADEYYHLTQAAHTGLTSGADYTGHFHATDRDRANHTGTQLMATISDLPVLATGTYTPTLTNLANIDATTSYVCQYMRVGDMVNVSGKLDIDPTTSGVLTRVRISLPIASNFTVANDLGGTASSISVAMSAAGIFADTASDAAQLNYICPTNANSSFYFVFQYRIK